MFSSKLTLHSTPAVSAPRKNLSHDGPSCPSCSTTATLIDSYAHRLPLLHAQHLAALSRLHNVTRASVSFSTIMLDDAFHSTHQLFPVASSTTELVRAPPLLDLLLRFHDLVTSDSTSAQPGPPTPRRHTLRFHDSRPPHGASSSPRERLPVPPAPRFYSLLLHDHTRCLHLQRPDPIPPDSTFIRSCDA